MNVENSESKRELSKGSPNHLLPLVIDDAIPRSNGVDVSTLSSF